MDMLMQQGQLWGYSRSCGPRNASTGRPRQRTKVDFPRVRYSTAHLSITIVSAVLPVGKTPHFPVYKSPGLFNLLSLVPPKLVVERVNC